MTFENTPDRAKKRRKLSPQEAEPASATRKNRKALKVVEAQSANGEAVSVMQEDLSSADQQEIPSVKDLASSNPTTRRSTFKAILKHLEDRPATSPLSSTQCLQLWRGFFVQIYMHDSKNALSVQNLLRDIAGTFSTISSKDDNIQQQTRRSGSLQAGTSQATWLETYHNAFYETLTREWAGIDSHRMNKYLLLVRFVLRELALIALRPIFNKSEAGPPQSTTTPDTKSTITTKSKSKPAKHNSTLPKSTPAKQDLEATDLSKADSIIHTLSTAGPLNCTNRQIPDGLRLHLLDILPDELFGALATMRPGNAYEYNEALNAVHRDEDLTALLTRFKSPVERMARSDSGAQRHVRLRAKETLTRINEEEKELLPL